jgi:hypothetical protein
MSRILLERRPQIPYSTPMTYELWMEINHALDPCLEARNAHWLRSFVSVDGHYSLCEFEVPYAEAVRVACREAGFSFDKVWQAEIWNESNSEVFTTQKSLFLVEAIHEPPMTYEAWNSEKEKTKYCLSERGINKLITWMSSDHKRSIYCFEATNAEDIRFALHQATIPFNYVWKCYFVKNPVDFYDFHSSK